MKHSLQVTLLLVALFVVSQFIGILLLALSQDVHIQPDGSQEVNYGSTAIGDRPELGGKGTFILLLVGVAIGTALVLLLIKLKAFQLWKAWFLLAVWLSVGIALGTFLPAKIALLVAAVLAVWKVWRPSFFIHNTTEVFMYAGIAVLIAPLFDLLWACLLLVAISLYDMYAVWHSKHMITLAKAQTDRNLFAGLYIPRKKGKLVAPEKPGKKQSGTAILGGGDMAFPLIFSGAVLDWLITAKNVFPTTAIAQTLLVTAGATVALTCLFLFAKRDKFYPAMPFISLGCFIGLLVIIII